MIYHNGAFIEDGPIFEFQNRIRLGDGVFDTMLVINGQPVHEALHRTRLIHDSKAMGIDVKTLPPVTEIIEKNEAHQGRFALNTLITRGIAERSVMPAIDAQPTISMRLAPAPDEFPPIHAIISETVRRNEGSPLSRIKSCNYGDNILALTEAQDKGANESILLNNAGHVTCASAGNVIACIDGNLITPPIEDGVMEGITRKLLIETHDVIERSMTREDLENANGIYITNSIRGISALQSLNGNALPTPSITIDKDFHIKQ